MSEPTVADAMTAEVLTVGPGERLEPAGLLMERSRVRQLVVVDDDGGLLGLLSYRALLRLLAARRSGNLEAGGRVEEFMIRDPITVTPATPLREAVRLMLEQEVSALPVVDDDTVVGILSEHDVTTVAATLLDPPAGPVEAP